MSFFAGIPISRRLRIANGETVELTKEDLLIETAQMEGFVSQQNGPLTVVLDTNLTEELIEEGFVRELVSKIQTMRKEAGFEVQDHIRVFQSANDRIRAIMEKFGADHPLCDRRDRKTETDGYGNVRTDPPEKCT